MKKKIDKNDILIQIPARSGSKRVFKKNLRYLGNRPLIDYAIEAAKKSKIAHFKNIYVNTDDKTIIRYSKTKKINSYLRSKKNASDNAQGDDFTYEFICAFQPKILVMINPACPLIKSDIIKKAFKAFCNINCDTLISCEETKMQGFFENKAINLKANEPLKPSQKNKAIKILNWAVTIWDTSSFLKSYKKNKSGYLGSRRELFPIDKINSIKISEESDFKFVEKILGYKTSKKKYFTI